MNNKKTKSIKSLIVILICTFIVVGITTGVCLYNYYGYIQYKIDYLEDYFDANKTLDLSIEEATKESRNKESIEKYQKWVSYAYSSDTSNLTFRIPETKENINNEKVTDTNLTGAYFEDDVLHIPNYFDVSFYSFVIKSLSEDGKSDVYSLNYNFFFSNIEYNYIEDFDPQYIYMTFVDGTGAESDKALQDAIEDTINSGVSVGIVSRLCSQTIMNESNDTSLASFSLLDYANDAYSEDSDGIYYIYKNPCDSSYDNQTKFGATESLTFCIYYMDESNPKSFVNIVEGTFTPDKKENGNVIGYEEFLAKENLKYGYASRYYQENYNEFIKPRIIKTGLIAFAASGVVAGLFGFIWLFDYEKAEQTIKKSKKSKK